MRNKIQIFVLFILVLKFTSVSATNVSGKISSNVVWDASQSPYYLTGNLTIIKGRKLTIMPGVEIISTNKYIIKIEGEMILNGKSDSIIYFHGDRVSGGTHVFWEGITAGDSSGVISGKYAKISHADVGLNLKGMNNKLGWNQRIYLENLTFYNNITGIKSGNYASIGEIVISNCNFINNTTGIYGLGDSLADGKFQMRSDLHIVRCSFDSNATGFVNPNFVDSSTFKNNDLGIFYGRPLISNSVFLKNKVGVKTEISEINNSLFKNNEIGIRILTVSKLVRNYNGIKSILNYNIVSGNKLESNTIGLLIDTAFQAFENFGCNSFIKNELALLVPSYTWFYNNFNVPFTGHFIQNNTAIKVIGGKVDSFGTHNNYAPSNFNQIYFLSNGYNLINASPENLNLLYCFFCDGQTTTDIENKIMDGRTTSGSVGLVNYSQPTNLTFDSAIGFATASFNDFIVYHAAYDNADTNHMGLTTVFCHSAALKTRHINQQNYSLSIYPNPAHERINIQSEFEIKSCQLFNLNGQKVFQFQNNTSLSAKNASLQIENIKSGIYVLKVFGSNIGEMATTKVVIN